jgi:ribosomal protein L35
MKKIIVNDKLQENYQYFLSEPIGENFHSDFKPELTPKEMLSMGIFCGKYMTDCKKEFPKDWFKKAKLSPEKRNCELNYFQIDASMPLSHWQEKGWIYKDDPRGWFQWYCRYYMGRRIKEEDERQIKRWKAFKRHLSAVKKNCKKNDNSCRKKQKQALLHWAYDSRKI